MIVDGRNDFEAALGVEVRRLKRERRKQDLPAAASHRLFSEPGLARRLSTSARAECLQKYVWPAVEAEWKALYMDLVRNPAPTAA